MQRQFTSAPVDLYLIPIPTPPTPTQDFFDLCQFTFSPHETSPVPVFLTALPPPTPPYLFRACPGRNQAQTLIPRHLPFFTHQLPHVPYFPSLATAQPPSITPWFVGYLNGLCTVTHNFVTDG